MSNPLFEGKPSRTYAVVLGAVCLAICVPLAGFIWTGLYARYLQDDYCYAAMLRGDNLILLQWRSYMEYISYSANRYSLTLFMTISEVIGRFTVPLLPGLAVVLWVGGFIYLFQQISRLLRVHLGWLESFLLSAVLVYLALYQAPNRVQILYWRAAMFPYLAPLITQTWLAGWIVYLGCQSKMRLFSGIGLGLLAFLSAGFSETGAVYQVGILGLGLSAVIIAIWKRHSWARRFFAPTAAAMLGSILGVAALFGSPVNAIRMDQIYTETQSILGTFSITFESLIGYIQHLLYRVTLPTFFTFLLFASFGWICFYRYGRPKSTSLFRLVLVLAGTQIIHLFLIFCIMIPSAHVESSAPTARALLSARVTSVLTVAFSGFLIGSFLASKSHLRPTRWIITPVLTTLALTGAVLLFVVPATPNVEPAYPDLRTYFLTHPAFPILIIGFSLALSGLLALLSRKKPASFLPALVLLLAALVHVAFASATIYNQIPSFRFRAEMWDMRDAQIRQMAAKGDREIEVRALDSLAGIAEIQQNPDHWVNHCAELYYGVDAIWAVEPVLNPPSSIEP